MCRNIRPLFNFDPPSTEEEIRAAHRRLILRVHPDAGGSADLAARINRAKDVLLDS